MGVDSFNVMPNPKVSNKTHFSCSIIYIYATSIFLFVSVDRSNLILNPKKLFISVDSLILADIFFESEQCQLQPNHKPGRFGSRGSG